MNDIKSIIFSVKNKGDIRILPYVPSEVTIDSPQNNEEFETINSGILNLIGNMGLRSVTIDSIFFNRRYDWMPEKAVSDPWSYVKFFEQYRNEKIPFRININDGSREALDMACTVESFSYTMDRNKNIKYSLTVKEYRFAGV